ncbi:MAG: hypothetical protein AMXMBFR48_26430 [Ignavibacteriales bacterium]
MKQCFELKNVLSEFETQVSGHQLEPATEVFPEPGSNKQKDSELSWEAGNLQCQNIKLSVPRIYLWTQLPQARQN